MFKFVLMTIWIIGVTSAPSTNSKPTAAIFESPDNKTVHMSVDKLNTETTMSSESHGHPVKSLTKRSLLSMLPSVNGTVTSLLWKAFGSTWQYFKEVVLGSLFRLFQRLATMLAFNDKFIRALSSNARAVAPDYIANVVDDYHRLLPQLRLIYSIVVS